MDKIKSCEGLDLVEVNKQEILDLSQDQNDGAYLFNLNGYYSYPTDKAGKIMVDHESDYPSGEMDFVDMDELIEYVEMFRWFKEKE